MPISKPETPRFSVTSDHRRRGRGARYKFVHSYSFLHTVYTYYAYTCRCAISFTFSQIPPAIFSWVTARERDSRRPRVQVPDKPLGLYLLHPNLMCSLILRSRVMLIATYKNDGSFFFFFHDRRVPLVTKRIHFSGLLKPRELFIRALQMIYNFIIIQYDISKHLLFFFRYLTVLYICGTIFTIDKTRDKFWGDFRWKICIASITHVTSNARD